MAYSQDNQVKMTLENASDILGLTDIEGLTEASLQSKIEQAERSLRLAQTTGKKEDAQDQTKLFEQKKVEIHQAAEKIRSYIGGGYDTQDLASKYVQAFHGHNQQISDVVTIVHNQSRLNKTIGEGLISPQEEHIVLNEGHSVEYLLDQDFKDETTSGIFWTIIIGTMAYSLVSWPIIVIAILINQEVGLLVGIFASIVCLINSLAGIIFAIPLSRFWLPPKLANFLGAIIYNGRRLFFVILDMTAEIPFFSLPLAFVTIVVGIASWVLKWFIMMPIYWLIGLVFKNHRIGRVTRKAMTFAGIPEEIVKEILNKNVQSLTHDELKILYWLSQSYPESGS